MIRNNKGFMMAEVIVVSSIVLIFLTTIFVSYNKIYKTYMQRISYHDAVTLYRLGYYRDNLIETLADNPDNYNKLNEYMKYAAIGPKEITATDGVKDGDRVFLINNNKAPISSATIGVSINPTFKDYLDYLTDAIDYSSTNYLMVMERCITVTEDDCKYAYLEIYDGNE